ncbi:type III-B CRISPR module-associated protein Cmr5 [Sorangium sp. So ce513]|uniref:type III-B CRISPR module-associated protein Cmr5 n=1 Tax=Sorangium sp. So ce513 TaxID=3133315 RepID=UPI003F5F84D1
MNQPKGEGAGDERRRCELKSLARNQRAYKLVTGWPGPVRKSAVELAQGYPVELRAMGTMQTLAFSMGKAEAGHSALAGALADWLLSWESGAPLGTAEAPRSPEELLRRLSRASRAEYLAADSEAVAFADAIKLIGKAVLRSETPAGPRGRGGAEQRTGKAPARSD